MKTRVARAILFTGLVIGGNALAHAADPATDSPAGVQALPGRSVAGDCDSTGHTALRTEMKVLRTEVQELQRDVRRLVEVLESRVPSSPERGKAEESRKDGSQDRSLPPSQVDMESGDLLPILMAKLKHVPLDEAILTGIRNSKTVSIEQPRKSGEGIKVRTVLGGKESTDAVALVTNLICDIEDAYANLWCDYREYYTTEDACEAALALWRQVNRDGIANEAVVREYYFEVRDRRVQSRKALMASERRLRWLIGLPPKDGELIAPTKSLSLVKPEVKWGADSLQVALTKDPAIRKQRALLQQLELQQDDLEEDETVLPGVEHRRQQASHRNAQLKIARERARLEDMELNVSHLLTTALQNVDFAWMNTQTHHNRVEAATKEAVALRGLLSSARSDGPDLLLDAELRKASAQIDYFKARTNLLKATRTLHLRKGSLLEHHRIELSDGSS